MFKVQVVWMFFLCLPPQVSMHIWENFPLDALIYLFYCFCSLWATTFLLRIFHTSLVLNLGTGGVSVFQGQFYPGLKPGDRWCLCVSRSVLPWSWAWGQVVSLCFKVSTTLVLSLETGGVFAFQGQYYPGLKPGDRWCLRLSRSVLPWS